MTSFPCKHRLPPDPEELNESRANRARSALVQFQIATGTDWDDAMTDLLADLMHLCDRETKADGETPLDFAAELERASRHYTAETGGDG